MWKIQLTLAINFISSEDNDEERAVHSKSVNKEIKADKVIEELFGSFVNIYQSKLEN